MPPDVPLSGELLQACAVLAVAVPFVVRGLIVLIVFFRRSDLSDENKKLITSMVCFAGSVVIVLEFNALDGINLKSVFGLLSAFAIIQPVAHNIYDKIMHPMMKLKSKQEEGN